MRGFQTPHIRQAEETVRLRSLSNGLWSFESEDGERLPGAALEPELVAELSGPARLRREPAAWEEIPESLRRAVLAAEDKRFLTHWGVDPLAMVRAIRVNLRGGELQGASTITQQLARNLFLHPRRTLRRKLAEIGLAFYLELRLSKPEILTLYLNQIYLGQDGRTGVAGVKAAARFYFGKELRELELAESATLAGLIRSPYRYDPRRDPMSARRRRDHVLLLMRSEERLSEAELLRALAEPLTVVSRPSPAPSVGGYFIDEVERELAGRYGREALLRYGLTVHTTMDPVMQEAAEHALKSPGRQGALVVLDPGTGSVLALGGGRDYRESPFNRATRALRQPGSAFKPFVYGAAFEEGFTPADILEDEPREYPGRETPWRPGNFGGIYRGRTTLREALAHSLNAATLDLASRLGPSRIVAFARRMGVRAPLEKSLAVALGAYETSLLELSSAYLPFSNGGFRLGPSLLQSVVDSEGRLLERSRVDRRAALDPRVAYLVTSLLESVVSTGTTSSLALHGFERPAAGKTGTTDEGRDAWFIGFTPGLLCGVWVGADDGRPAALTGAKDALPVWAAFMKEALAEEPPEAFPTPDGIASARIDPASGLRARSGCPSARREWFIEGTEPAQDCPLHPGGLRGWFARFFRPATAPALP